MTVYCYLHAKVPLTEMNEKAGVISILARFGVVLAQWCYDLLLEAAFQTHNVTIIGSHYVKCLSSQPSSKPSFAKSRTLGGIHKLRHTLRGRGGRRNVTLCDKGGGRDPKFHDITYEK